MILSGNQNPNLEVTFHTFSFSYLSQPVNQSTHLTDCTENTCQTHLHLSTPRLGFKLLTLKSGKDLLTYLSATILESPPNLALE